MVCRKTHLNAVGDDVDRVEAGLELPCTIVRHLANGDSRHVHFEVQVRESHAGLERFGLRHHVVDGFASVLDAPQSAGFPLSEKLDAERGRQPDRLLAVGVGRHSGLLLLLASCLLRVGLLGKLRTPSQSSHD